MSFMARFSVRVLKNEKYIDFSIRITINFNDDKLEHLNERN